MTKLLRLTAREAVSLLEKHGFKFVRQTGSHRIFKNQHGIRATIPMHPGKILHPKIVKQILEDIKKS